MKYIIELEDEPRKELFADAGNYYRCKQRPFWFISEDTRDSLTPYTESDRKIIEDEVWAFVRFMLQKMDSVDRLECFGSEGLGYAGVYSVVRDMTYQEAKAKYEAWKAEREQIRVGCEVHHKEIPELKIYVTDMDDNSFGGFALCRVEDVCDYGDRFSECNVHQYKPTGRVFSNIVELLKKMKGETT